MKSSLLALAALAAFACGIGASAPARADTWCGIVYKACQASCSTQACRAQCSIEFHQCNGSR